MKKIFIVLCTYISFMTLYTSCSTDNEFEKAKINFTCSNNHGKATIDKTEVYLGELVKVTSYPDYGYEPQFKKTDTKPSIIGQQQKMPFIF